MEDSLKQHEMQPFDIEPNYYEDLLISQNKLKSRDNFKYFDEKNEMAMSKSDFMKKTMNDHQFVKSNATIVSASPFRAVLRRKETENDDFVFRGDEV